MRVYIFGLNLCTDIYVIITDVWDWKCLLWQFACECMHRIHRIIGILGNTCVFAHNQRQMDRFIRIWHLFENLLANFTSILCMQCTHHHLEIALKWLVSAPERNWMAGFEGRADFQNGMYATIKYSVIVIIIDKFCESLGIITNIDEMISHGKFLVGKVCVWSGSYHSGVSPWSIFDIQY